MTLPRTLSNLDAALGREYVAVPWPVLPIDSQAQVIGELSVFTGPDWNLVIDPIRETAVRSCAQDYDHGPGVARVNSGFGLCVGCATKLLGFLLQPGEQVWIEVLREASS